MAIKRAKSSKKQAIALPNGQSYSHYFTNQLADLLDPPELKTPSPKDVQAPLPDIVDWAQHNFIDPTTERLVELAPFQQRMLRKIMEMILDKQVTTVVWSTIKKSGKCAAASDKIELASGEIVEFRSLIGKEFKLRSVDENKRIVIVNAKAEDNGWKPCIQIVTELGHVYKRTFEHPFLVHEQGWVPIQRIHIGDYLIAYEDGKGFVKDKVVDWIMISWLMPTVAVETENHVYLSTCIEHNTTSAGLIGAYWAQHIEMPNEVISIANDAEQAQGRIYAAMVPTMKRLQWDVPDSKPEMRSSFTGSKIRAISTNYAGEAGGNYGLTLWSELWAYTSEARQRLWEEMTPVPTRNWSVRWVETYAGFLGESTILWNLYCQAFKEGNESEPLGVRVPGLEDLPCYYLSNSKMFVYWDHEPRMPWQTPDYYAQQRADLRPKAYQRLHQNMWVASEDVFIEPRQWDALDRCEPLDEEGDKRAIVLAADGSIHNDLTALSAVYFDIERQGPDVVRTWLWRPNKKEGDAKPTVDLTETIGAKIDEILGSDKIIVLAVVYDPYQLHSVMTDLKNKYDRLGTRNLFVEFPQTNARIAADQYLYTAIVSSKLRHTGDALLREHVLNAVVDETTRGFRLDKDKTSNKIDLAVATSMASYTASQRQKKPRKFIKA